MMKEFKRKVYQVDIYGTKVDLTPPTFGEMLAYEKAIVKDPNAIFDFLEERGLSKEMAESMYTEDLMEVIAIFREKKS